MKRPSIGEQILDLFLLRTSAPDYAIDQPYYTTGSIVAAAIIRVAIIGIIAIIFNDSYGSSAWWWTVVMLAMWGIGAYPAWIQYNKYNDSVEELHQGTLCGACKHFNKTNQLCMILDEHVTTEAPPCEGEAWEPKS